MPSPQAGTIIVVDDDRAVLSSLRFLLETEGFAVRVFASAKALLAAADIASARCLLIDYRMPDLDGVELAKALRKRSITAPIFLVTAHGDAGLGSRAAAAGIDRVVEKPLLDSTLLELLSRIPSSSY
jgi:two-component system, LuxR family, response regulator FixJ